MEDETRRIDPPPRDQGLPPKAEPDEAAAAAPEPTTAPDPKAEKTILTRVLRSRIRRADLGGTDCQELAEFADAPTLGALVRGTRADADHEEVACHHDAEGTACTITLQNSSNADHEFLFVLDLSLDETGGIDPRRIHCTAAG